MDRHDDGQRGGRLVTLPAPPINSLCTNTLTAPADRGLRAPAHAVASTTAAILGGSGSVHRQTGMQVARTLPGDRTRAGARPRLTAAMTTAGAAGQSRPSLRRPPPAWRHDAGVDTSMDFPARPAVPSTTGEAGVSRFPCEAFPYLLGSASRPPLLRATAHDSGPPWVASPSTCDSFIHGTLPFAVCRLPAHRRRNVTLKEP